jgi:hypothetical protein
VRTPAEEHAARESAAAAEVAAHERRANGVSLLRLGLFLVAVLGLWAAFVDRSPLLGAVGASLVLAFFAAVVWHARILARRDVADARRLVHVRHLARLDGRWTELPTSLELLPGTHAYARDLDLVGHGSLVQRLDVTHTTGGEATLAAWLGAPADAETIRARQACVRELAERLDFREQLETAAALAPAARKRRGKGAPEKLDPQPFLAFAAMPRVFGKRPWLAPLLYVLPVLSVAAVALSSAGLVPPFAWMAPVLVNLLVNFATAREVRAALDLVAARRGFGEAFAEMFGALEREPFAAPELRALRERAVVAGELPSAHLRVLDRWAGFAELRSQFPLHLAINNLLLWDLQCLLRLERWAERAGSRAGVWFDTLAELEALASLATLAHQDPAASFPELAPPGSPFVAEGLVHPLLPPGKRVANDVTLAGAGTALIVTGSNMAGKSTLLRAVGLNVALALAGGPVTAASFRVPSVRLRASMRADDSLQSGASYFHAELTKLRSVVEAAADSPPVFFLLDELLRGTNASARHLGARAIVLHLLGRGGCGLVATHDVALAALERELEGKVTNAHFTDVVRDGEMVFDYRLRPGVVRTSNALRLLRLAGIDVPDEHLATEDAARESTG